MFSTTALSSPVRQPSPRLGSLRRLHASLQRQQLNSRILVASPLVHLLSTGTLEPAE
jgi:hypothetical protein